MQKVYDAECAFKMTFRSTIPLELPQSKLLPEKCRTKATLKLRTASLEFQWMHRYPKSGAKFRVRVLRKEEEGITE